MNEERLTLTESPAEAVAKLAEGNPGAAMVLLSALEKGKGIDPDSAWGGMCALIALDCYGIYGTDIYILHNDICDNELPKTLAVLRATQLGFFNMETLKDACSRQDRSGKQLIPVEDLYLKVKKQLPNFDN